MTAISNLDQLSAKREELFTMLYKKAFPAITKYISRMGGSFDEAKDVFQDALVIYYEKTVTAKLNLDISDTAYLIGIAKHLWIRRYKEGSKHISLDGIDITADDGAENPSNTRLMHF